MKKIFTMLMVMCMILTLTACGCDHEWLDATCQSPKTCKLCNAVEDETVLGEHTWVDASCEAPKTCTVCNITEGEALTHAWIDADCDNPKTCVSCDAIDGEALGHDMAEANYQVPATCQREDCDYTEGEALEAGFVGNSLTVINAETGIEYDYITSCWDKPELKTTGKVVLSDYQTFESAEGYEAVNGYVWHSVTATITFSDENAWNYGVTVHDFMSNYFQPTPWNSGSETISFNGVNHDKYTTNWSEYKTDGWNKDNKTLKYVTTISWRMPVSYDGFLFGFYDGRITPVDGQYIWEFMNPQALVFRFPAVNAE